MAQNGDDLLEQMKRDREAQDKIRQASAKEKSESRVERMKEDVGLFHRFVLQVLSAFHWSVGNVIIPVWRVVRWPFWKLVKQYRRLWSLIVYQRDEFDNLRFSKTRAGIMLSATVFFLWFLLMPTIFLVGETISYSLTVKTDEVVYLYNSQEIDSVDNVHSIQGATTIPITEDASLYFRVEGSLFHHLWSLVHKGNLFYPDYVAGTVSTGVNKCVVTSYGFRFKTLMRNWEIYPHILYIKECNPVNGVSIGNAT